MSPRQWGFESIIKGMLSALSLLLMQPSLSRIRQFEPIQPPSKLDFDDVDNANPTSMMWSISNDIAPSTNSKFFAITLDTTGSGTLTNHDSVNNSMSLMTPKRMENSTNPLIIPQWGKMAAADGVQSGRMGRTLQQNH
ncbi:unnamed protein product [Rodentolepis nana]|uniref:Secreted protein n=1 Tax=Rodentolepis nana TaxID=102285 RepID=A0A0R3TGG7_RODNA|nr:unnamed protein product [Rodentolepis nana]